MQAKTFAIVVAVLMALFVIELIRQRRMTFKYSMLWLTSCLVIVVLAFYDDLLLHISLMAGFKLLSNFIFFLSLVFFVLTCLLLTVYINEANTRSEMLAETLAAIDLKVKKLEEKINRTSQSNNRS